MVAKYDRLVAAWSPVMVVLVVETEAFLGSGTNRNNSGG